MKKVISLALCGILFGLVSCWEADVDLWAAVKDPIAVEVPSIEDESTIWVEIIEDTETASEEDNADDNSELTPAEQATVVNAGSDSEIIIKEERKQENETEAIMEQEPTQLEVTPVEEEKPKNGTIEVIKEVDNDSDTSTSEKETNATDEAFEDDLVNALLDDLLESTVDAEAKVEVESN